MISSRAPVVLCLGLWLASATLASAQSLVQDRYGPPPAAAYQAASGAAPYGGRMLGWAGKRGPGPAQTTASAARPEPLALARQFGPQTSPPPPAAAPQAPRVQPGYEPVLRSSLAAAAEPAPALLGGPPAKPLPTSIYGQAAPTPPPAPQAFAQASPAPRPGGSQLYSLHREYGMTPDAIPAPPAGDNFILVGPPDTPETSDDGEDPAQGLDRQF